MGKYIADHTNFVEAWPLASATYVVGTGRDGHTPSLDSPYMSGWMV